MMGGRRRKRNVKRTPNVWMDYLVIKEIIENGKINVLIIIVKYI